MNRQLTAEECFAKAQAYEECAEHLGLEWTDDVLERNAGDAIARSLTKRAKHWRKIGQNRAEPTK